MSLITFLENIGQVGIWISTAGLFVILWIIFQSISFFINQKRLKEIFLIRDDMERMEKKLDRVIRTIKK